MAVSFIDSAHGWGLRQVSVTDISVVAMATSDGGTTWAPKGTVVGSQLAASGRAVGSLSFANGRDGWAYGGGIFATHDGGQTWAEVQPLVEVRDLAIVGSQVWALEGAPSFAALCAIQSPCPLTVWSAPVAGGAFRPLSSPALSGHSGGQILVSAGAAYLYVGHQPPDLETTTDQLYQSRDGGRHWARLPDPPCQDGVLKRLAITAGTSLWLGCGGQPYTFMAPTEHKYVYRSFDGGLHWQLTADTGSTPDDGSTVTILPIGTFPSRGHLGSVVSSSPTTAWITLIGESTPTGGRVVVTRDGGRTWTDAAGFANPNDLPSFFFDNPVFVDSDHGWLLANNLYRTVDGGQHWSALGPGLR
jgi:photosystem II stability/assembly factor-like uncharacterized protein